MKPLLDIPAVAQRLNVPLPRAYSLARESVIPVVRIGRQLRVDPEALEEWVRRGGRALPGGWRNSTDD